jgi:hypothetical protein
MTLPHLWFSRPIQGVPCFRSTHGGVGSRREVPPGGRDLQGPTSGSVPVTIMGVPIEFSPA